MSYAVRNGVALWRDKALPGADASSLRVLSPIVAVDAAQVYVLGKPFAANRAKFAVLNAGFATDGATVWQVLETKLKPLTGADAATFRPLTDDFGVDAAQVWYRDKQVRLSKGAGPGDFRPLDGVLATDGRALFYATKRIAKSETAGVPWAKARAVMIGAYDGANPPLGKVTDGEGVWWLGATRDSFGLMRLDGASFDQLDVPPGRGRWFWRRHCTDGTAIWYRGRRLEGARAEDLWAQSENVLEAGGEVWAAGHRTGLAVGAAEAGGMMERTGYFVHGLNALHVIRFNGTFETLLADAGGEAPGADPDSDAPYVDAALTDLMQRLAGDVFSILDQVDRIESGMFRYRDALRGETQEGQQVYPLEFRPAPPVQLRLVGQDAVVTCGDVSIREPLAGWLGLLQRLWLRRVGQRGDWTPWLWLNNYPRGTEFQGELCRRHQAAFIEAAGRAYEAGATEAAEVMLHQVLRTLHHTTYDSQMMDRPLARLPLPLVRWHREHLRFGQTVTNSTNLAAGRYLLASEKIVAEDWRTRAEALELLNGVVWATGKGPQLLGDVIPWVDERFGQERHPFCREILVAIITTSVIKGHQIAERAPQEARPVLSAALGLAIKHGIDPEARAAELARLG